MQDKAVSKEFVISRVLNAPRDWCGNASPSPSA